MLVPFLKYQALGNDFIIIDYLDPPTPGKPRGAVPCGGDSHGARLSIGDFQSWAPCLCDRRLGVGGDGILILLPPEVAGTGGDPDAKMVVINSDGSLAGSCGNGFRCVVLHLWRRSIALNGSGVGVVGSPAGADGGDRVDQEGERSGFGQEPGVVFSCSVQTGGGVWEGAVLGKGSEGRGCDGSGGRGCDGSGGGVIDLSGRIWDPLVSPRMATSIHSSIGGASFEYGKIPVVVRRDGARDGRGSLVDSRVLSLEPDNGWAHEVGRLDQRLGGGGYDPGEPLQVVCVWVGNPHGVVLNVEDPSGACDALGEYVSTHPAFPHGCNAGFARVDRGRGKVALQVYERGAGPTMACGTGAAGAVLAACKTGLLEWGGRVVVEQAGGVTTVQAREDLTVQQWAEARFVYSGTVPYGEKP